MKSKLSYISEVVEEWVLCQQKWTRLEPIFSQYEVQRQLSSQTTKFRLVDRKWRGIMRHTYKDSKVISATGQNGLLNSMKEANSDMEGILHRYWCSHLGI